MKTWRIALPLVAALFVVSSACTAILGDFDKSGTGGSGGTGGTSTSSTSTSTSTSTSSSGMGGTGGSTSSSSSSSGMIMCNQPSDCGQDTECQLRTCVNNMCGVMNVADGTVTTAQTAGDCKQTQCDGNGGTKDVALDSDVPDDSSDCTNDSCNAGQTTFTNVALGAACTTFMGNQAGFCDGAGTCSQCSKDSECPEFVNNNECQSTACTNFACVKTFTPMGTPLTGLGTQPAGDCHQKQCDGAGGVNNAIDNTDVPVDGKECTNDLCNVGIPSNTNKPAGTPCNNGMFVCNAVGECGCQSNADCTAPSTCGGGGTPNVCGCTPTTCAALSKTCGTVSDGCFAMLSCDNGTKNGSESDVDCGGPVASCATRCAQGKTCTAASDCASGNCVDGYCCDTACTGACQACSAAKKGAGQNGVCGNVAAGTDPDNECATDPVAGCQKNGSCNGAGACQLYAAGTVCVAASCSAGVANNADTCNGTGMCIDNLTVSCSPYVCSGTACGTTCANDTQCVSTHYCAAAVCTAKKANGTACAGANECTSGICTEGVCCNSTCTGLCQSCLNAKTGGANGACNNVTSGTDPDNECAGAATCNGAGACNLLVNGSACTLNGECSSGFCVDGFCCSTACNGTCVACSNAKTGGVNGTCGNVTANTDPDSECAGALNCTGTGACQSNGVCSTNVECASGFCVDGYCCNTACTGTCQACINAKTGGANGTCGNVTVNTDPDNECAGGECNGAGACEAPNGTACTLASQCQSGFCVDGFCCGTACTATCQACSNAKTGGANGTCANVTTNTDPDNECVGGECNGAGACELANGNACTLGSQCISGNCVDGFCCNAACSGLCQACSNAKTGSPNGTCANVTSNTDPDNECAAQASSTCGTTGVCNGAGACQLYASGTVCLAQSCSMAVQQNADTCNGTGTCVDGGTTSCGNYECNVAGTACLTTCSADTDCTTGNYCNGANQCVAKKIIGSACAGNNECSSTFCTDGVCCGTACGGTCQACDMVGSVGTCSNLFAYDIDTNPDCGVSDPSKACNGNGKCLLQDGYPCSLASQCIIGSCFGIPKTCGGGAIQ